MMQNYNYLYNLGRILANHVDLVIYCLIMCNNCIQDAYKDLHNLGRILANHVDLVIYRLIMCNNCMHDSHKEVHHLGISSALFFVAIPR